MMRLLPFVAKWEKRRPELAPWRHTNGKDLSAWEGEDVTISDDQTRMMKKSDGETARIQPQCEMASMRRLC
jgi:hypothetical protein